MGKMPPRKTKTAQRAEQDTAPPKDTAQQPSKPGRSPKKLPPQELVDPSPPKDAEQERSKPGGSPKKLPPQEVVDPSPPKDAAQEPKPGGSPKKLPPQEHVDPSPLPSPPIEETVQHPPESSVKKALPSTSKATLAAPPPEINTIKESPNKKSKREVEDSDEDDGVEKTNTTHKKITKSNTEDDEAERIEGMNVFALMDSTEIKELLERIDIQCSITDNYTVRRREKAIAWDKVSFSTYGARQCKAVWGYLKHHTRTYRIMSEVVTEVKVKFSSDKSFQTKLIESLPGFPHKPPTAMGGFYCYNREQWAKKKEDMADSDDTPNFVKFQRECRAQYEAMPDHIKEKYNQQAELVMAEYKRNIKQFYVENPGVAQYMHNLKVSEDRRRNPPIRNPSVSGSSRPAKVRPERIDPYEDAPPQPHSPAMYYMQARVNELQPPPTQDDLPEVKQAFFEKWKNMKDKKRVKWIDYCIRECVAYLECSRQYQMSHPGYNIPPVKIKQILTIEEIEMWESANGRPNPPRNQASDMFVDELLANEENDLPEDKQRTVGHQKWNELDWYPKEMHTMRFKMSQLEYKKKLQEYFSKIPEFMKPTCLKRIPKKFLKILEEVDKVPSVQPEPTELLITAEEGVVYDEENCQKPKKSRKKKREIDKEDTALANVTLDEFTHAEANDNEDTSYSQKKSIKRKRNKFDMEDTANVALDEFTHAESNDNEDTSNSQRKKKKRKRPDFEDKVVTFQQEYDEDYGYPIPLQTGRSTGKAIKIAKSDSQKMFKYSDDRVDHILDEDFVQKHKPSSKYFPEKNSISKNDIYESIRGIFDGRATGRMFSIYYYYSKYVAAEPHWINAVNSHGLEKTALDMIKTFLALPGIQQDTFIHQSFTYHTSRRHLRDFPDEPKPPPRQAKNLYFRYVAKKRKRDPKFVAPPWKALPEAVQIYYTKQLYHETKLYMRSFDSFISSMTPTDFVNYALYKYKIWELSLYTRDTIVHANRQFVFPFTSSEVKPGEEQAVSGVDEDFKIERTQFPCSTKIAREFNNPFVTNKAVDSLLPPKKKRHKIPKDIWDDSDSDSGPKDMKFSLLLDEDEIFLRKVKKAEMFDYPLDDVMAAIYPDRNNATSRKARLKRISQGTQTPVISVFVSVETQTTTTILE